VAALEALLKNIQSEVELGRRDTAGAVKSVLGALERYERALEAAAVLQYCTTHNIRKPDLDSPTPRQAAEALLEAVESLPELKQALLAQRTLESAAPSPTLPVELEDPAPAPVEQESEIARQFRLKFPELTSAAELGKLLIFGAFSGRTRSLPGILAEAGEWVDTAGDGTRSVSNAVRRIRNGHVFAVIICDQAISHQHADPVVSSAKNQKIPIGYAGKGGVAALARALESIEEKLSSV
jgi:hypothetical protein